MRVVRDPPTTGTNKIVKRTLVHQKWRRDRVGGDAVYVRGRGDDAYRAFDRDDEQALRDAFVPTGASASGTSRRSRMDLSFTAEEQAFAAEVRAWLAGEPRAPAARSTTLDDEIAWGRQWQAQLAADRWVGIHWPAEYGGRGASPVEVAIFNMEYARARAPQPVNRVGINLAGPTLLAHGTDEQKAPLAAADPRRADEIWCQLFSEPDAGSDLAALRDHARSRSTAAGCSAARRCGRSYAQFARWGICLARTDPDAPKHRGISYLVVDMEADGIEIRPLVQITGEAEFNEVFLDEVFVPEDHLVGGLNQGWAVANTTLAHERGTNFPFKEQVVHEVYLDELYALAEREGVLDDVEVADALGAGVRRAARAAAAQLAHAVAPRAGDRARAGVELDQAGLDRHDPAPVGTAVDVCGDAAPLWRGAADMPGDGKWQRQWLWSRAASIAGGTSEVQRNIIAERILGLPRETDL